MTYVIKVSKKGHSVGDNNKKVKIKNPSNERTVNNNLLIAFASIYLKGAKLQINRYKEVFSLCNIGGAECAYRCLHEFSNLLEDLNTISFYMKKCGYKNKNHNFFKQIRNHIRHDLRDGFGKNNKGKNKRSLYLKIDQKLQEDISFNLNNVKIGETLINIDEIVLYLDWAENIIKGIQDEAEKRGYFKKVK